MRDKNEELLIRVGYLISQFKAHYFIKKPVEFEVTINVNAKDWVDIKIINMDDPEQEQAQHTTIFKNEDEKRYKGYKNRKFKCTI